MSMRKKIFVLYALGLILLGVVLFLAGFLGEMVSRSSQERNKYQIKDRF